MKRLIEYINEKVESFSITNEWLHEKYRKFNAELFNNELPDIRYVSVMAKSYNKNAYGSQGFDESFYISSDFMENGMYVMRKYILGKTIAIRYKRSGKRQTSEYVLTDENTTRVKSCIELRPHIYVNTLFPQTKENYEATLIHEMIHLWISKDGLEPKQAHGKEFRKKVAEIKQLAKDKYGINYLIHGEKEDKTMSDEEMKTVLDKNKKRGGGVVGIYIILSDEIKKDHEDTERFLFCTKRMMPKILDIVKYCHKRHLLHFYVSEDAYQRMVVKYGNFGLSNTYRYYSPENFDKAKEIMLDNATDILNESLTEAKKPYIKPEIVMYEIPAKTDLSNINLEEVIELIDKNEQESKPNKNDKYLINP